MQNAGMIGEQDAAGRNHSLRDLQQTAHEPVDDDLTPTPVPSIRIGTPQQTSSHTAALIGTANAVLADMASGAGMTQIPDFIPAGYTPIRFGQARNHVGNTVRVVGHDGTHHLGRLIHAEPGILFFERQVSGGTFSYDIKPTDVTKLYVLSSER